MSKHFVWLLLLLPTTPCLAERQRPSNAAVTRELLRILSDDPELRAPDLMAFWQNAWFEEVAKLVRRPWAFLILVAVLLGLYFLGRSCRSYLISETNQTQGMPVKTSTNHKTDVAFILLYAQAVEQSEIGDYRAALIALHQATVNYILTELAVLPSGKKYSNNDLKEQLEGQVLYQPFNLIANYAEIASFSSNEIGEGDFRRALGAFEQYFLKKRGRQ